MNTRLVVASIVLVLGAACGSPGAPPAAAPQPPVSSGPDTPVSNTPGDEPAGRGGAQRVEPRSGLVDVRAIRWDRHKVVDGGSAVDVFFWHGIEECYGIDHIEADYGADEVAITIFEGRNPEAEVCIEMAVRKVVRVTLDEPLGDRRVTDGGPQD